MQSNNEVPDLLNRLDSKQKQLGDLHARLRRGPLMIKSQEKVKQGIQEKLDQARTKEQELLLDVKEKEKRNQESENMIARRKMQLSESKNNKEYQALKQQIAADEESASHLADEVLEAMEICDEHAKTIHEIEEELEKVSQLLESAKLRFEKDQPIIQQDIQTCSEELKQMESELSRDFREIYNQLVKFHGGDQALAIITNQKYCSGCNQTLPINSIAQVIQGRPITCSACGRLLYVPEGYQFEKG